MAKYLSLPLNYLDILTSDQYNTNPYNRAYSLDFGTKLGFDSNLKGVIQSRENGDSMPLNLIDFLLDHCWRGFFMDCQ